MKLTLRAPSSLKGVLRVPGDKSISHRALMLGGLARGETSISGLLEAKDCLSTLQCMQQLGVEIERKGPGEYLVHGKGSAGLTEPVEPLDCGNSGTTMRLLLGLLCGQPFTCTLIGDDSLSRRPMDRVAVPLREMGAVIDCSGEHCLPPVTITGTQPKPLVYEGKIASAQVKSCLLLAGLYADGATTVRQPAVSRDHTERMLRGFGAKLSIHDNEVTVYGPVELRGTSVEVPGDFSSAAPFLVAAALLPEAELEIQDVGLNPTRTGLVEVMRQMGADITVSDRKLSGGEPVGTLQVKGGAALQALEVGGDLVPRMIDEVPLFAVLATAAEGTSRLRDAAELRVKESDRLQVMAEQLTRLGGRVRELPDGLDLIGPCRLKGAEVDPHGDHRLAMALAVAALAAEGETVINGAECVDISYPTFFEDLRRVAPDAGLTREVE